MFATASIANVERHVHIPRVLLVVQARAEKLNGLVSKGMAGILVEFCSPVAHRVDQTIRFFPGQSVTNVLAAKDWMWSSLFVIDVPPIPIEHETRCLNSHQVAHDFAQQWLRHASGGNTSEEPLPSSFE